MNLIKLFSDKLARYIQSIKLKICNPSVAMVILLMLPLIIGFNKKGKEKSEATLGTKGSNVVVAKEVTTYSDNRPSAKYRLEAVDQGIVYKHGDGPDSCDYLGARDIWVWKFGDTYYMHYDGAGPKGWLACLAESKDLVNWSAKGPVLQLGKPGSDDCASASYGTTYFDGNQWYMFYLGTPHVTTAPEYVPSPPYLTMMAKSNSPSGPWMKEPAVVPFRPSDMSVTNYGASSIVVASPGMIIKSGAEYLMFFSWGGYSAKKNKVPVGNISIAHTKKLDGKWTIVPQPILPGEDVCENSSLYFEPANQTWFLFTDHIGDGYTDAIWVYWSKDITKWDSANKAVVLDSHNCKWSKHIIGLPSVIQVGNRLAIFYDGNKAPEIPPGVKSHMNRDIGLAWLNLPLIPPGK
jgi:predicted GH43/DUF377 family glycosyl hydrolase